MIYIGSAQRPPRECTTYRTEPHADSLHDLAATSTPQLSCSCKSRTWGKLQVARRARRVSSAHTDHHTQRPPPQGPPSLLQSSYCPPPSPSCRSIMHCVHPVQHVAYTQSMQKLGTGHWVRSTIPSRRRTAIRDAQVSTQVSTAPPADTCAKNAAVSFDRACVGMLPAITHSHITTARTKQRFAGLRQPLRRANICAVVVGMQKITAADVRRSSMQSKRPEDHCGSPCATSAASGYAGAGGKRL